MISLLLYILIFFSLLIWVIYLTIILSSYRKIPHLTIKPQKDSLTNMPFISIIIPTRNESKRIEKCISSLKSQTYPKLEILIIDNSTDNTEEIIRNIVKNDERFAIIKQKKLPQGWIGKPFALQQASSIAKGEWLVFIDADTSFDSVLIQRAIEYAVSNNLDMISLGPRHICDTFWVTITQPIFLGAILGLNPLRKVNNPKSKVSLASGPFIAIKHTIFDKVGGYESIKGHIADDIGLAKLVKTSGFKLRFVNAQSLLSLRMYDRFGDIWEGWGKNSFLGLVQQHKIQSKFLQVLVLFTAIFVTADILILPFLLIIITSYLVFILQSTAWINFLLLACITWLVSIISTICVQRLYQFGKTGYVPLTLSLGGFIFLAIFINSAFRTLSGRGVTWKGIRYHDKRLIK
jgi:chlorobactene glucosyltransferase